MLYLSLGYSQFMQQDLAPADQSNLLYILYQFLVVTFLSIYSQGVHNSRLLQAYCRFDPRVTPVVRAVRVWMREATQRRINSYATSLMVLACLQVTQPPVLPCLQDLGPWPRNMDWFKQHKPSEHVTFEPWSCDFTPIESLKPSTNTSSVGR